MGLTKQEMFDRAYRGLASQGWAKAYDDRGCVYQHANGNRCAWGWVDTSLGTEVLGAVETIATDGIGLAAKLGADDMGFAVDLQATHDNTEDDSLQSDMMTFARRHSLTIPSLP